MMLRFRYVGPRRHYSTHGCNGEYRMSDELIELEEEEHTSQLTAPVLKRIVALLKPHWKWVVGFLITIMLTSVLDAYLTSLNKEIVDVGIPLKDRATLTRIAIT